MSKVLLDVHYGSKLISLEVEKGIDIFTTLNEADALPPTPCGGKGKCGKCIVYCYPAKSFSGLTKSENELLPSEKIKNGARLACQAKIIEDGEVHVVIQKGYGIVEIGESFTVDKFDPFVRTEHISLPGKITEPDLETEIKKALKFNEIDFSSVSCGSGSLKNEIAVKLKGKTVISVLNDNYRSSIGITVDLGTTTIVVALLDLETGKIISSRSCLNPQQSFGADVISRMSYIISTKKGLRELNKRVIDCINEQVEKSIKESKIGKYSIDQYIVSGNTTMIHILFSLPVKTIAQSPYVPFTNSCLKRLAPSMGLIGESYTEVYSVPSISAFVGGDIVSGILASRINEIPYSMLMDLGTNGELVYACKDKILCCSTAAGPAFEGANISCGTGNVNGAIFEVRISKNDIKLHTINNSKPSGICGTGIISLVAELIRNHIIDRTGSFSIENCNSDSIKDKLDPTKKRLYLTNDIFISQKDIRNFQLAKAAIRTGYNRLVELANNINPHLVFIAGGFGVNLNSEDVFTTGMIPEQTDNKLIPAGNTSLEGSIKLMFDRNYLRVTHDILRYSTHFYLSSMENFQKAYVENLNF